MQTYAPTATITSGSGCKVRDPDGKTYLDFTSGIAVHNVGHCHSTVVKAVQDQVATLGHCSNLFYNASQALLAQRLSKLSLNGKCFLCNSGAEANEAMIKLARLWGHEKGNEIITMQNSSTDARSRRSPLAQTKVRRLRPVADRLRLCGVQQSGVVAAAVNERTVGMMLEAVQARRRDPALKSLWSACASCAMRRAC